MSVSENSQPGWGMPAARKLRLGTIVVAIASACAASPAEAHRLSTSSAKAALEREARNDEGDVLSAIADRCRPGPTQGGHRHRVDCRVRQYVRSQTDEGFRVDAVVHRGRARLSGGSIRVTLTYVRDYPVYTP